ncbi:hypothetical protein COV18_06800 [Candidatus Woesearchaeota archaeon CG10_big_fil_rev_8_21_14_0_10_37_12]|nr:MAG: hypothetical protein COV18_06800 [Candidatus Woesearchaeota archaeon CG10_big_fil_rev_8_21_14_0_10_37_12]
MNSESAGLIIFALIALAAVFAFLLVLGGPASETVTGNLAGTNKVGTSYYVERDAVDACADSMCTNGIPGIPTGKYDVVKGYECECQYGFDTFYENWGQRSYNDRYFYRSKYIRNPPNEIRRY